MMASIEQQIAQQDLAQGAAYAKLGADAPTAYGYAAGAGAARALGGLFGMEDPRIVEQRAISKAVSEMDFRDPNNLYKLGQLMIERGDFDKGQKMLDLATKAEYYQGQNAASGVAKPKIYSPLDKTEMQALTEQLLSFAEANNIDIDTAQLRRGEGAVYSALYEKGNMLKQFVRQGDPTQLVGSPEMNQIMTQMFKEVLGVNTTSPTGDASPDARAAWEARRPGQATGQ
jgi:hypothetical protein